MTTEMKTCTVCAEQLPATREYFYADKKPGSLRARCKACEVARQMVTYRKKNPPRLNVPATAKACTKCKVEKALDDFPRSKRMRDGHCSWCKTCHAQADKARKTKMAPEQKQERQRARWANRKLALQQRRREGVIPDLRVDKKKRSETLDLIGHVPFGVAGIYSITNRLTGQVYVGSALCVRGRWATHIWRLRRGNHHSRRLQGAWTRDGETQFAFALLEQVTAEQHLLTIEQAWINFLRAYAPRGGYNTSPLAGSTRGIKKTPGQIERHRQQMHESAHPYFVKHPDGRTELVPNIGLFAQANGLSASNLRRVGAGQQAMHKGYWCRKATEQERRSFLA